MKLFPSIQERPFISAATLIPDRRPCFAQGAFHILITVKGNYVPERRFHLRPLAPAPAEKHGLAFERQPEQAVPEGAREVVDVEAREDNKAFGRREVLLEQRAAAFPAGLQFLERNMFGQGGTCPERRLLSGGHDYNAADKKMSKNLLPAIGSAGNDDSIPGLIRSEQEPIFSLTNVPRNEGDGHQIKQFHP